MESEKLYTHYTNKSPSEQGIMARSVQRLNWLKQYHANGKCKQKLINAGILARGEL